MTDGPLTSRVYIAGKTPKSVARRESRWAHKSKSKFPDKLEGWQLNAIQRFHDLDRLVTHRKRHGPDLGPSVAWASVVANLCRVRDGQVTVSAVNDTVRRLGLPPLNGTIVAVAVREIAEKAWGRYALYTPEEAGTLLGVKMAERSAADILKLDAVDEPRPERKRRIDRENKQRYRAAEAASRPPTKAEIAKALGISRPTLDDWIRKGKVDRNTGELTDFTKSVPLSSPEGSNRRTENVKSERVAA
jgi:predicted DNA-binding transcriptional regulator AlpA